MTLNEKITKAEAQYKRAKNRVKKLKQKLPLEIGKQIVNNKIIRNNNGSKRKLRSLSEFNNSFVVIPKSNYRKLISEKNQLIGIRSRNFENQN